MSVLAIVYARKRAEKRTPKNEAPVMARVVPSLVEDDDEGVEAEPVALAPRDKLVAKPVDDEREPEPLAVGRPENMAELVRVLQLDEEATRAVYGTVVIGPKLSGG